MNVSEVMSKRVVKVTGIALLPEVAAKMGQENIGVVPVEEEGRVVGLVTDRDIAIRAVANRRIDVPVKEIMTRDPITVTSTTTIADAVRTMQKHNVRRLLVMDGNHLVGLVSLEDLIESEAEEDLLDALRKLHSQTRHG